MGETVTLMVTREFLSELAAALELDVESDKFRCVKANVREYPRIDDVVLKRTLLPERPSVPRLDRRSMRESNRRVSAILKRSR